MCQADALLEKQVGGEALMHCQDDSEMTSGVSLTQTGCHHERLAYFIRMVGSPSSIHVRRMSGSEVAALASLMASPSLTRSAPNRI